MARGSNGKDRADDTCVSYLCDTGARKDFKSPKGLEYMADVQ